MGNAKKDVISIMKELKELNVWEEFCMWSYSIYPNINTCQKCFEFCYEVFKLNESFFLNEWKNKTQSNKKRK
ncbi:hypothetical protein B6M46_22545 [Salmonella enterica subsp. enterica serovar Infantis]|nr:hypothetical protein [Salmonella enterica]ECH8994473.1 hypothetical protein [Salmonella enterica subsp. enterica serovar Javiana]EDG3219354.1 hypothetical protein [Salmonella enterica subsp. enterica serovar Infantis]EJR7219282.1 hypothetical protein [Salmonella enterica subsp. enterica serovar Kentucky]